MDHPKDLRIIDLVMEGDTLGIVMELVRGKDLRRTPAEELTHPAYNRSLPDVVKTS